MIYLDNAATTFPKPEEVYREADRLFREYSVNAGRGTYKAGKIADKIIEDTRKAVADFVGARDSEAVIFTHSATEAMNHIIQGIKWNGFDVVYVSPYEHNAVARTIEAMRRKYDFIVSVMPVDDKGFIDIPKLVYKFEEHTPSYIFINMVSNVTGYILPVDEIAREAKAYDAKVIVDGAQGLGMIDVDLQKSDIDILVFAGHKSLYGPFGVGGYINNSRIELEPFMYGGNGSDSLNLNLPAIGVKRYEIGSPDIVSIGTLKKALELMENCPDTLEILREKTEYLREKLSEIYGVKIFQMPESDMDKEKFSSVVSFAIEGYKADDVGTILDEDFDIAVRTGYHCAPFVHDIIGSIEYGGTVRVSIGKYTTYEELDRVAWAVCELSD
ncbi:MAG: aminotransferase class V-fold PLP-dependent enzyme [Lachnospiraceae bacterium]|nr:aminotransferase class V-fold PLP-dependent enzyme [Lachnospiraceae bacterium]MBQ2320513.1 aminotransferase class V-fold PLP-dependent enzyme [Lachnospiraceae bacterium]